MEWRVIARSFAGLHVLTPYFTWLLFEGIAKESSEDLLVLGLFYFGLRLIRIFLGIETHIGRFFVEELMSSKWFFFLQLISQRIKRLWIFCGFSGPHFSLLFQHIFLIDNSKIIMFSLDNIRLINLRKWISFLRIADIQRIIIFNCLFLLFQTIIISI